MKCHLLDTNVLIALLWPTHEKHAVVARWFLRHRDSGWATCPMTEAGFVRIVSNPAFSRDAVTPREAVAVLSSNTSAADHRFWADDLGLADATAYSGDRLVGHNQLTDAYLLGLAVKHRGVLATLDEGIGSLAAPGSKERLAQILVA